MSDADGLQPDAYTVDDVLKKPAEHAKRVRRMTPLRIAPILLFAVACADKGPTPPPVNNPPAVSLFSPASGMVFESGTPIQFEGRGHDQEDGALSGSSLVWESSLDGRLGIGETFSRSDLSAGEHTVTLTATDSGGKSNEASVIITVLSDVSISIVKPKDGEVFWVGDDIPCSADVSPVEFSGSVVWSMSGSTITCSNGFIKATPNEGTYTLRVRVSTHGLSWSDSVRVEVRPVLSGQVFPIAPRAISPREAGYRVVSAKGAKVVMFAGGATLESVETSADGRFSLKAEGAATRVCVFFVGHETTCAEKDELDETLNFILIPRWYTIPTGALAGSNATIDLETALRRGSRLHAGSSFFWIIRT